jgi:hypothetical protein
MARQLILVRDCAGIRTRIECEIRPLAGGLGLWTMLCAAGLADGQPSAIKAQGPFHGPGVAEGLLEAIARSLELQGYTACDQPPIWRLHLQAELRRIRAEGCRQLDGFQFSPDQ